MTVYLFAQSLDRHDYAAFAAVIDMLVSLASRQSANGAKVVDAFD